MLIVVSAGGKRLKNATLSELYAQVCAYSAGMCCFVTTPPKYGREHRRITNLNSLLVLNGTYCVFAGLEETHVFFYFIIGTVVAIFTKEKMVFRVL